ncbi:hypothetical protein B0H15DRAFT_204752 [Mycena belliarum]|uniref:Uncharacterized protein n=1 Tax=Mycena belliarum TaxID=1033014 RepID=A0AAD6XU75_9AGAR|nr:hypothetical protein B0H15DRAFT_204752 [Mycena belliae]
MNPSRPRPSVLELFDPLSRDTHSPESDKENILPDSGFDYDFLPPVAVKHPSPVRLTRRLVEVGDVTVDSSVLERGDAGERSGLQEDDDDDDDDTTDTVTVVLPPTPRTPLGDVTFDRERTPMRSKMYRRNLPGASVAAAAGSKPASSASDGCPVLINAVNTTVGPSLDATAATPSVVISCPDESPSSDSDALSTSLATLALATPTGSLIGDTTLAFPTPSPSEASTSLVVPRPQAPPPMAQLDPDTSSAEADADLHASFALHMSLDAAETSFDLLNDKISFLAHNEESYYFDGGLESILDLEQENANESGWFPYCGDVILWIDVLQTQILYPLDWILLSESPSILHELCPLPWWYFRRLSVQSSSILHLPRNPLKPQSSHHPLPYSCLRLLDKFRLSLSCQQVLPSLPLSSRH